MFRVTAEDNSFKEVSLSSTAQSGITKFPLGSSTVEFRGLDVFGNEATCFFTVVINGKGWRVVCVLTGGLQMLKHR